MKPYQKLEEEKEDYQKQKSATFEIFLYCMNTLPFSYESSTLNKSTAFAFSKLLKAKASLKVAGKS